MRWLLENNGGKISFPFSLFVSFNHRKKVKDRQTLIDECKSPIVTSFLNRKASKLQTQLLNPLE